MDDFQQGIVKDLTVWINENCHTSIHISDIALKSGYSRYYIQRLFRKYTGVTLGYYVRTARLGRVARELENSDQPVAIIALKFGYESQQTFSRIFKRHYGCPPGEWRNGTENIKHSIKD